MSDRLDKARREVIDGYEAALGAYSAVAALWKERLTELESAAHEEGWVKAMDTAAWHLETGLLKFSGTVPTRHDCAAALRSLAKEPPK